MSQSVTEDIVEEAVEEIEHVMENLVDSFNPMKNKLNWLLLALPGAVIVMGLVELWTVAGIIIGIILSWFLIAEKLRLETQKYNAITIPQYLHRRYKDDSNIKGIECLFVISFSFSATRKFKDSFSITHGPAIKKKQFFLSLL